MKKLQSESIKNNTDNSHRQLNHPLPGALNKVPFQ